MKKRLLFISTIFPSKLANRHATYSTQLLSALRDDYAVDIINPIPWLRRIGAAISDVERVNGMEVHHPTYWYTPGLLRHRYGSFYYASIKSCASKLINDRGYDVVLASWLYPDGWAAAKIAKVHQIPLYLIALGTDANKLAEGSKVTTLTVETISQAKKTICMSHALKDKLLSVGAETDKLAVLYNGVDRNIFQKTNKDSARAEFKFSCKDKLVLFVGNLLKTKGVDELSNAFAIISRVDHFKDAKLIIAGSGKHENKLKKNIRSLDLLERTIFMGSCSLNVVAKLMNAADVVCLPSYSEGLPNVVLEALCCNAKVVATQVGGIPELQARHENLFLVPPKDEKKLAEVLMRALNIESHEDRAEDIYSWKEQADKLVEMMVK